MALAGRTMRRLMVSVLLTILFPSIIDAQQKSRQRSIPEIAKLSQNAVVLIETFDASHNPMAQGSGFIISADGKIVTNFHVIEGADSALVKMSNGAFFPVEGVLVESRADDLAEIKVSGHNLPHLALGDQKDLVVGDHVVAIGNPLGLENTVSDGIVSAIREDEDSSLIQTTAPISPGNSGGPLLNLDGKVVGILAFKIKGGENLNFAVGIDALKTLMVSAHPPTPLETAVAADGQPRKDYPPPADPASKPEIAYVKCLPSFDEVSIYQTTECRLRVAILECGEEITVLSRNQDKTGFDKVRDQVGTEGYLFDSEVTDLKPSGRPDSPGPLPQTTSGTSTYSPEDDLPSSELSKLTCGPGQAWITSGGTLECDLYNGTNRTLNEVTILVTVFQIHKNKRDVTKTEVLSRRYRFTGHFAPPLSSTRYEAELGFTLGRGQTFEWTIQGAKVNGR